MNIFYLDSNPFACAKMHNNKHCVKMILEYAQLMSTAHRFLATDEALIHPLVYKSTHVNHPSAIWVRSSQENYIWLYNMWVELCNEYTHRYKKTHASETKLKKILAVPPLNIPKGKFTEPPQAMPEDVQIVGDSVSAYRKYYMVHKSNLAKWKNREIPSWYFL